jgi:membrane associated rhomboid family serine protease
MASVGGDRVTLTIIAVTILAWGGAALSGLSDYVIYQGGFIPMRLSGLHDPFFFIPALLTPLTATLIHGGLFHLGGNMLMLYFCGRQVEKLLGWAAILPIYVIGAYASAFAQYLLGTTSAVPMIGASGAISAIMGIYAVLFSRSETKAIGPIPAYWVRVIWLAAAWAGLQWLIGMSGLGGDSPIAVGAHVGGFFVGVLMVRPLLRWRYSKV